MNSNNYRSSSSDRFDLTADFWQLLWMMMMCITVSNSNSNKLFIMLLSAVAAVAGIEAVAAAAAIESFVLSALQRATHICIDPRHTATVLVTDKSKEAAETVSLPVVTPSPISSSTAVVASFLLLGLSAGSRYYLRFFTAAVFIRSAWPWTL